MKQMEEMSTAGADPTSATSQCQGCRTSQQISGKELSLSIAADLNLNHTRNWSWSSWKEMAISWLCLVVMHFVCAIDFYSSINKEQLDWKHVPEIWKCRHMCNIGMTCKYGERWKRHRFVFKSLFTCMCSEDNPGNFTWKWSAVT